MDSIDKLIVDIHGQRFYQGTLINPTRLFLIAALLSGQTIQARYSRRSIESLIYRYYSDNPDIAVRHPRQEIRNISKHGIDIIKLELQNALETWQIEATENVLQFDMKYVYLQLEDGVDYSNDVDYLWMVLHELFYKIYRMDFPVIAPINGEDNDISVFGTGSYRNHLMEEIQYCVCCDEYNINKLVAVHILPDCLSGEIGSREDIANGLIMCREHAQEYLHKRFYFDSFGKIQNVSSSLVHRNMRLSKLILTSERAKYLKKYELIIKTDLGIN